MHPVEDIRRSGVTLTVEGLNWVRNCDAHRKKSGIKLLYNPSDRKFRLVGEKMLEWEHVPAEAGPPDPRLSSPREWERKAVVARRVRVNMLQFLFGLQLTSHTVKPFVTLSNFRIKWEVYFSKNCVRSSLLLC